MSKSLFAAALWVLATSAFAAGSYSGSWYNPNRDGEGFHIEILEDNQAMVIWFTYPGDTDDSQAEQAWILGVGTISEGTVTIQDAFRVRGPVFGDGFNKDDRVIETWGDVTIIFSDDDSGRIDYTGKDGTGTTDIIRLTRIADQNDEGTLPVGFSGAWYNPETDGQGWFLEVLSDTQSLVYFFTYDENGNQAWNIGVGFVDGNRVVVPNSETGKGTEFGSGFDKDNVVRESFAEIEIAFDGCGKGSVRYETRENLERGTLPIARLTKLDGKPCRVLAVEASEGGLIQSDSGKNDCLEGRMCFINLNAEQDPKETLNAVPRTGYTFVGWSEASQALCSDDDSSCVPDIKEELGDATLAPIFKPEGSIFFPPKGDVGMCRIENIGSLEVHCEIKDFESYGYGPLSDYIVTDPNVLFVDNEARRRELDTLSPEIKDSWCANGSDGWPNYWRESGIDPASYTPTPPDDIWDDATLNQLGTPMLFARLYYDYFDDPDALGLIVRSLRVYAEAKVWMDVDLSTDGENRQYNLGLQMYRYLLAWKSVRNEPAVSSEDRRIIDDYLYRLILLLTKYSSQESGFPEPSLWREVTNHQNPKEISTMMYGILTKNDILFQRGIKRFFVLLDGTVRPDASHTYESQRAGSALDYSLNKTSELIRMAELAANQGYDLYTVEVNGVSLIDIIEFHVAAFEDETLLHPYSGYSEMFCDPEQCALWNDLYNKEIGHPKERGWPEFEVFRARFPESPLIEQFQNISPDNEHIYKQEGPYFQGCEFRDVSTAGS